MICVDSKYLHIPLQLDVLQKNEAVPTLTQKVTIKELVEVHVVKQHQKSEDVLLL